MSHNLYRRFISEVPKWAKFFQVLCASIGAVSLIIISTPEQYPPAVLELAKWGMSAGALGVILAQFTNKSSNNSNVDNSTKDQ